MSDEQKAREDEVFGQELSLDDLDAAAGGSIDSDGAPGRDELCDDAHQNFCDDQHFRPIHACAATVESGSNCWSNDACYQSAVVYQGMTTDCGRAHD